MTAVGRRVHGRGRLLAAIAAVAAVVATVVVIAAVHRVSGPSGPATSMLMYNPDHDPCLAKVAPRTACAGEGLGAVHLAAPYIYLAYPLCVTKGSATITGVDLYRPSGVVSLTDWGVRPRARGDQYSSQSASSDAVPGTVLGWPGFTHSAVASSCAASEQFTDFGVSVTIGSSTAVANGLQIHYRSAGRNGTAFEPFSISECTAMPCHIMADHS